MNTVADAEHLVLGLEHQCMVLLLYSLKILMLHTNNLVWVIYLTCVTYGPNYPLFSCLLMHVSVFHLQIASRYVAASKSLQENFQVSSSWSRSYSPEATLTKDENREGYAVCSRSCVLMWYMIVIKSYVSYVGAK